MCIRIAADATPVARLDRRFDRWRLYRVLVQS